jgi:hypothetical protein
MKTFLSFIIAGLIGGLVCFGAIYLTGNGWLNYSCQIRLLYYSTRRHEGPDFAAAAELAQKAVVLIEAEESKAAAQQRYRQEDPMSQWMRRFGLGGMILASGPSSVRALVPG